jgi:hypothetical protein
MLAAALLSTIIALVRAVALELVWYQFAASGDGARDDDPATPTAKGSPRCALLAGK